ncbi:hypothetical protein [Stackebrandtia nassauensis]|nr:hypothetical protein [Stackebrandtia nassauensis]
MRDMTPIATILALLALLGLVHNGLAITTERWRYYADEEPKWYPGKAVDAILDLGGLVKEGIGQGCLMSGVPILGGALAGMLLLPDHVNAGLAMLGAVGLHVLGIASHAVILDEPFRRAVFDVLVGLGFAVAVALIGLTLYLI